jgi:hypothetical protein
MQEESVRLLRPCALLSNKINLSYKDHESYMYAPNDNLICFDTSENGYTNNACLYFNKVRLIEFLQDHNFKIIWTVLAEKNVIADDYKNVHSGAWPTISGIYTINESNNIIGSVRRYD